MLNFLWMLLGFTVAISLIIGIHEYGHYWVAKRLGVKVLRFSLGFGKPIWRKQIGETEWVVSPFPLGGYVHLLDEAKDKVAPEDLHRAYNRQHPFKRILILLAGPFANFVLAMLVLPAAFMLGVADMRPLLGMVPPQTPAAQIGLQTGDKITHIAGQPVVSWTEINMALLEHAQPQQNLPIVYERAAQTHTGALSLAHIKTQEMDQYLFARLGLMPYKVNPSVAPMIGQIMPNSPAERAGLQAGDLITAVDLSPVSKTQELIQLIGERAGRETKLQIKRGDAVLTVAATPDKQDGQGKLGIALSSGQLDAAWMKKLEFIPTYTPKSAVERSLKEVYNNARVSLIMLKKVLFGQVSTKVINGPITTAEVAGDAIQSGLADFLRLIGLISVGIGVLNLLPIPVLDGGRVVLCGVEWVQGKPLGLKVEQFVLYAGAAAVFMLMGLAFYNDISRLVG